MSYDGHYPKIPGASITLEDAAMLQRMYKRNDTISLKLVIETPVEVDVVSYNVVAEMTGYLNPEQVLVTSGHLDS